MDNYHLNQTRSEVRNALLTQAAIVWRMRCKQVGMKLGTQKRTGQLEAYLQGVLAVMTSAKIMDHDEAQYWALMVATSRAEARLADYLPETAPYRGE